MPSRPNVCQRARLKSSETSVCRVLGCPHPVRAASGNGLDTRFCRKHADHYSRHGSPYKRSYTAKELAPHRRAVREWLRDNRENAWVSNAAQRVQRLYDGAGSRVEAFRLAGLPPEERARKAWARLRDAGVSPERVIEAWLVIAEAIRRDPAPEERREFKQVQAAKLIHRLASGTHKRWEREVPRMVGIANIPIKQVTELHKYPHSRGRVLRVLGKNLEEACGLAEEEWRRMTDAD